MFNQFDISFKPVSSQVSYQDGTGFESVFSQCNISSEPVWHCSWTNTQSSAVTSVTLALTKFDTCAEPVWIRFEGEWVQTLTELFFFVHKMRTRFRCLLLFGCWKVPVHSVGVTRWPSSFYFEKEKGRLEGILPPLVRNFPHPLGSTKWTESVRMWLNLPETQTCQSPELPPLKRRTNGPTNT